MADPDAAPEGSGPAAHLSADGSILTLTLPATLSALPWAQDRLAAFLRAGQASERTVGRAELLLEELATNVIKHGGLADHARARLCLAATLAPAGGCRLTFEDPGGPFDPVGAQLPGRPTRLEEARIGGLGLVLLQRMAYNFDYVRLPEGRNRLGFSIGGEAGG